MSCYSYFVCYFSGTGTKDRHKIVTLFLLSRESYTEQWHKVVLLNAAEGTVRMKKVMEPFS